MISSFYAYARQLVSIEALILKEIEFPSTPTIVSTEYGMERSKEYKELAQNRVYLLTEMARTLGYDLVPHSERRYPYER